MVGGAETQSIVRTLLPSHFYPSWPAAACHPASLCRIPVPGPAQLGLQRQSRCWPDIVVSAPGRSRLGYRRSLDMLAALVFGRYLTAVVVLLMYSGGQYLGEARRASRQPRDNSTLARVPRSAVRYRSSSRNADLGAMDRAIDFVQRWVPIDGTVRPHRLDQSALTGEAMPVQHSIHHERLDQCRRGLPSRGRAPCGGEHLCRHRPPVGALSARARRWRGSTATPWCCLAAAGWRRRPAPSSVPRSRISRALAGRQARGRCLIKGGEALETLARVRSLVIDKTGTLTHGQGARRINRGRRGSPRR